MVCGFVGGVATNEGLCPLPPLNFLFFRGRYHNCTAVIGDRCRNDDKDVSFFFSL